MKSVKNSGEGGNQPRNSTSDDIWEEVVRLRRGHDTARITGLCREGIARSSAEGNAQLSRSFSIELARTLVERDDQANWERNIEEAIFIYEALEQDEGLIGKQKTLGAVKRGLGNAYSDRLTGDRVSNLTCSIRYHAEAMKIYEGLNDTIECAELELYIAHNHSELADLDAESDIDSAIRHAEHALSVLSDNNHSKECALAQWLLWQLYRVRTAGSVADNQDTAIEYEKKALSYFNRTEFPEDWGTTQESLAISYHERINGDTAENLRLALDCFGCSLDVFRELDLPEDVARVSERKEEVSEELKELEGDSSVRN